jgi:hypothetical protein
MRGCGGDKETDFSLSPDLPFPSPSPLRPATPGTEPHGSDDLSLLSPIDPPARGHLGADLISLSCIQDGPGEGKYLIIFPMNVLSIEIPQRLHQRGEPDALFLPIEAARLRERLAQRCKLVVRPLRNDVIALQPIQRGER